MIHYPLVVIDDKPGTKAFQSNINQVFGYCLAFKVVLGVKDTRPIVAALRRARLNSDGDGREQIKG